MKKTTISLLLAATAGLSFSACQHSKNNGGSAAAEWACDSTDTNWAEPFRSVESADSMVNSYLLSVNYLSNDSNIRSFIIDANAMRKYLFCEDGQEISHMKVMLAHNVDYIRKGGFGQPCGYSKDALTVVIAGYDTSGNYVYAPTNKVMDYSMPCPKDCPRIGTASSDRLPIIP